MLYSEELVISRNEIPQKVQEGLDEIKRYFSLDTLSVLEYSNRQIAVPVTYSVSLPTRGAVKNIDIRHKEPILIIMSLDKYPEIMPRIVNDRKDFPKKFLSHLYVSTEDKPACFCLVRNNPNEWFANKRIVDLLIVVEQWLYKAGNGLLVEDGNEFDPTRLEDFSGHHIYRYGLINDIVTSNRRFLEQHAFAILLTTILKSDGNLRYRSNLEIPESSVPDMLNLISKISDEEEEKRYLKLLFTPIVWNPDNEIEADYCTEFPKNYEQLKAYFIKHGIDISALIHLYYNNGLHIRNGLPLIHAIRRPKKVIGFDGAYEFINFVIYAKDQSEGIIPDEAGVDCQSHIEPYSTEMARTISGEERNLSTIFLGAGSLGSKMILHDARSGKMNIGVVDDDIFLEHNLARHVLFESKIGSNKAKAIINEISTFYKVDVTSGYKAFTKNLTFVQDEVYSDYQWLVDTTASKQVQNLLITKHLPSKLNVARCELANDGKLGLLYIEGKDRNPRLDDLMNLTHYLALTNKSIEDWRRSDEARVMKTLDVGLGCSSSTTVMSDDLISFHASLFSRTLSMQQDRNHFGNNGFLFRSIIESKELLQTHTENNVVKPFEVYPCHARSGWQVRFMNGMSDAFFRNCKQRGKVETGGALIGVANYKTKTIHVFEIVIEPQDSRGTCAGFTRGVKGLPEHINQVKKLTGQVIGYIGEWHTHPMDLERLSETDEETIEKLKILNRKEPIPTLALIVTNTKILPFVFE